ncbi:MAG: hypothetical protein JNL40_07825 [Cyclobacteriaceae bacterium]|nr:hypothetical protein [Cyclobacteriaceae bacterium]
MHIGLVSSVRAKLADLKEIDFLWPFSIHYFLIPGLKPEATKRRPAGAESCNTMTSLSWLPPLLKYFDSKVKAQTF